MLARWNPPAPPRRPVFGAALFLMTLALPLAAQLDFTDDQLPRVTPVVRVARAVGPAVVNIYQEVVEEVALPWPYSVFDPGGTSRSTSLGSGVIIDPDGFILTNSHVIKVPDRAIQVRMADGSNYLARLVNTDPGNDVALLKVAADHPLPTATLGTSSDLMVGEGVVAIGNPLGNENSVTSGIVSSLFRDVSVPGQGRSSRRFRDFIQLDAAINPGNSGGPLLNMRGEVIGVNWAIATEAEGIGFAIPIDRVRSSLIDRLLNPQVVADVVTGLSLQAGQGGGRVALSAVADGSPAAEAGLRAGDQVVSIGGTPVRWEFDVQKALYGASPGDRMPVVVQRGDALVPAEIVLGGADSPMRYIEAHTGLRVVDHPHYFGVVVESVDPSGPAARLELRRGDLIDGLAGKSVDDTQALYSILRSMPPAARAEILLFRAGQPLRGTLGLR